MLDITGVRGPMGAATTAALGASAGAVAGFFAVAGVAACLGRDGSTAGTSAFGDPGSGDLGTGVPDCFGDFLVSLSFAGFAGGIAAWDVALVAGAGLDLGCLTSGGGNRFCAEGIEFAALAALGEGAFFADGLAVFTALPVDGVFTIGGTFPEDGAEVRPGVLAGFKAREVFLATLGSRGFEAAAGRFALAALLAATLAVRGLFAAGGGAFPLVLAAFGAGDFLGALAAVLAGDRRILLTLGLAPFLVPRMAPPCSDTRIVPLGVRKFQLRQFPGTAG